MANSRSCPADRGSSFPIRITQATHIQGLHQPRRNPRRPDRHARSQASPQTVCLSKRFTRPDKFTLRQIEFTELKFQHRSATLDNRNDFRAFDRRQIVLTLDLFEDAQLASMHVHFVARKTVVATSVAQEHSTLISHPSLV